MSHENDSQVKFYCSYKKHRTPSTYSFFLSNCSDLLTNQIRRSYRIVEILEIVVTRRGLQTFDEEPIRFKEQKNKKIVRKHKEYCNQGSAD